METHPSPSVEFAPSGELGTVAGRYRLVALVHAEGMSEVYRALDSLTGDTVALKVLPEHTSRPQLQAEVSALRLLDLPGVARLLDEGVYEGRPFLTMELVDGDPFPGAAGNAERRSWRDVRRTMLALLEILARVHARGVVHRDLKPDNVLVDASARPTVLDFGLSAGAAIGSGLDPDRNAAGTPAYAAPEQILGQPVDARADLYALGVMLYEALAGAMPHEGRVADEFLQARLHGEAAPLATKDPDASPRVCALVDRLLARDPADRPRSAVDVLQLLRGGELLEPEPNLPWLGGTLELERVAQALAEGRSADVVGRRGMGKSRFVAEVLARLRGQGQRWIELRPSSEPFGSLAPLMPEGSEPTGESLEETRASLRAELERTLDGGCGIAVDAWEALDRWSAGIVDAALAERDDRPCAILCGRNRSRAPLAAAVEVRLGRLDARELQPLFAGPDRLFHLREDGARELWNRTHGHPGRVADEVAAWVRAGLARWSGAELAIDHHGLGRLRAGLAVLPHEPTSGERALPLEAALEEQLAWIALASPHTSPEVLAEARREPLWRMEAAQVELVEAGALRRAPGNRYEPAVHPIALDSWTPQQRRAAHARIASALEPGSEGRLLHLVQSAQLASVPEEACAVARQRVVEGKLGEAEAALAEGLHALRTHAAHDAELPLFREWIVVALADFTPQAVDRVLYELSRSLAEPFSPGSGSRAALEHLERFARAALTTLDGGGERALVDVESVPHFADLELERWRQALRVQAARGASPEREQEVLDDIMGWAAKHPEPEVQASLSEWLGRLRYRQERHMEAAAHCERAARLGTRVHARLSAMLNGASALLEACELEQSSVLATKARQLAAASRHTLFEVRAEWILRSAAYRAGAAGEPDLELAKAAGRVGMHDQEALVCLTEAAVAWRADLPIAAELANRAAARWSAQQKVWGAALARALALAAQPGDGSEETELAERVADCPDTLLAGQSMALLVRAGAVLPKAAAELAQAVRAAVPEAARGSRREVLSAEELLAILESSKTRS